LSRAAIETRTETVRYGASGCEAPPAKVGHPPQGDRKPSHRHDISPPAGGSPAKPGGGRTPPGGHSPERRPRPHRPPFDTVRRAGKPPPALTGHLPEPRGNRRFGSGAGDAGVDAGVGGHHVVVAQDV